MMINYLLALGKGIMWLDYIYHIIAKVRGNTAKFK